MANVNIGVAGANPFHLSRPCGSAAHRRDEHTSWEGCALPHPPRGRGLGARASGPRPLRYGETRFPHPPRRGLIFTLAHAAPQPPSHPPPAGGRRRTPSPSGGGLGRGPSPSLQRIAARAGRWGNRVSPRPRPWEGLALTQGDGETGSPHAPARGRAWLSRREMGKPGFPTPPPVGGFGRVAPSHEEPFMEQGAGETRFPHAPARDTPTQSSPRSRFARPRP